MVRAIAKNQILGDKYYYYFAGNSLDTKPSPTDALTGSVFLEVDTSDVYFWDEATTEWLKAGGSNE